MSEETDHGKGGLPPISDDRADNSPKLASPPTSQRGYRRHTAQSIGLDLEAYRAGRYSCLLPPYTRSAKHLPLPSSPEELAAVAALPIYPEVRRTLSEVYINRCKRMLKKRTEISDMKRAQEARKMAEEAGEQAKTELIEARKVITAAKKEAADRLASLNEAQKLVGEVLTRQMEAFLANEPLNGEVITADQARMAALGTASTIAKLGGKVAEEATKEAEQAVFEETVRSMRERIATAPNPAKDSPN